MSKTIWIVVSLLMLVACSSTAPKWSLSAPKDTATTFITTGSGPNLKSAKADALQQLSNRLIVNVSNTTSTYNEKMTNGTVLQGIKSLGQLNSEQFSFVGSQVISSETINNQTYVLIEVNKASVFTPIQNYLTLQITPLIDLQKTDQQIIANGLLLWPQLNTAEQYIELLHVYGEDLFSLKSELTQFKNHFMSLISDAELSIQIGSDSGSERLGLAPLLQKEFQTLLTKKQSAKHKIKMIIVGPTVSSYKKAPFFATSITAEQVITINDELVMRRPISSFEFGLEEVQVLTEASASFFNQLALSQQQ
ncbi:LPP20 family lipoprotein [Psychrosphaera haliotis]|nr:LPP20 family lipoprotein [Psychrosphaera haliotis]